jgi:hypothetical protein
MANCDLFSFQSPEIGENDEASVPWRPQAVCHVNRNAGIFCPAGESSTAVFAYLHLQRLPQTIGVLLSEVDPADMRAITEKADRLIILLVHDTCATLATDLDPEIPDFVAFTQAAVQPKAKDTPTTKWPQ